MASQNDMSYREHMRFNDDSGAKLVLDKFGVNDIDEASATVTYIGKEDAKGTWVIQKIDSSSGKQFRFATQENNEDTTNYTDAWTGRAGLTYGTYSQAF